MAQGPPGGVIGVLGCVVAVGLIVGVAVTIYMVHKKQQKTGRSETDNDLTDLPPAHKPAPPPPKKKNGDKGHLTSDDIQVVHLDKEEEMATLPLQPPYYDMAPSEPAPFTAKPNHGHADCDVQYAELDTAALASSPSPRNSVPTADLVEYATIQNGGRSPDELSSAQPEYVSYVDQCPDDDAQPAQAHQPVTFLPQQPYAQQPPDEPVYSNSGYPAPPDPQKGSFLFPKKDQSAV